MNNSVTHPLATGLTVILTSICALLSLRVAVLGQFYNPIWTRFSRARRRLANIVARIAAGRAPRLAASRAPDLRPAGQRGGSPAPYLPCRPAWLVATLGYHVAGYGSQLQHLLHDPATLETLAAAHPADRAAVARILRPLCRLLGLNLPPILQAAPRPPAPKRTRPAKPARPKPAPLPPLLPLYPQRRPRLILYPNPPRKIRPA